MLTYRQLGSLSILALSVFAVSMALTSSAGNLPFLLLERRCKMIGLDPTSTACKDSNATAAAATDGSEATVALFVVPIVVIPAWGQVADLNGRRLVMVAATLGGLCGPVAALLLGIVSWPIFLAITAFGGLGGGVYGFYNAAFALMSDFAQGIPKEGQATVYGAFEAVLWLGLMTGPFVGGVLAKTIGTQQSFWFTAACWVAGLVISLCVPTPDKPQTLGRKKSFQCSSANPVGIVVKMGRHRLGLAVAGIMCFSFTGALIRAGASTLYLAHYYSWSVTKGDLWAAVSYLVKACGLLVLIPLLVRCMSIKTVIVLSTVMSIVASPLYALANHDYQFFLLTGLDVASMLYLPLLRLTLVTQLGTEGRRAEVLSYMAVLEAATTLLGTYVGNKFLALTIDHEPKGAVFFLSAGVQVLGLVSALCLPAIVGQHAERQLSVGARVLEEDDLQYGSESDYDYLDNHRGQ